MLDLKLLLLLNLLSFSLQDKNCLVTFEGCTLKEGVSVPEIESKSEIAHCVTDLLGECYYCEDGYAVSYDGQKCISFQKCYKLDKGDNKCFTCNIGFLPNSNGQCERSTCSIRMGDDCVKCHLGYYLKDKKCQKITLPYCEKLSESNENECDSCLEGISPSNEGKCVAPEKVIKGCIQYDTNGKCTECTYYYTFKNGNCDFKGCSTGMKKISGCGMCNVGFELDDDGICIGFDGTKDTSKGMGIKMKYVLLALVILSFI